MRFLAFLDLFALPRFRRQPVPENEPLSGNAVADALLMLAVQPWAKDFRHHIELAQVAKDELASGWESGAMETQARETFTQMLKSKGKR